MWLHHPSGKIAVYVKDPVDVVYTGEVKKDKPKKQAKKK